MGNVPSGIKVNHEIVQKAINKIDGEYLLISVLVSSEQECLIKTTIKAEDEEEIINGLLKRNKKQKIIIYGRNCNDEKMIEKYKQLSSYGFKSVVIYIGGLFEWLCLQDIYGKDNFSTDGNEIDLLKYK
jgi:23S rRNA pseudoU1915 N3-methylase RlmH|tara:strand:+ start:2334 stop:2720 length:387 start_codon:yes stop_codon:yes gene_type:complete